MIINCISFGQQNPQWKGKIEYDDGITVVKNPKEPIYGEGIFGLKEELTIGKKKGEEDVLAILLFGSVAKENIHPESET